MKSLIVNADDFGATYGINRGVIEAHQSGIVTSASMMVEARGSAEAAQLAAQRPSLGVGLHVVIAPEAEQAETEIERQLERFGELTGKAPTHIDAHHNAHREDGLLPAFLAVSERHGLPLRGHSPVRHIGRFYGQWDGETHLEGVSPDAFAHIVDAETEDGFNEMSCHPGYVDEDLVSSYTREREAELETLCDTELRAALRDRGIDLVSFRDLPKR
jgi:chitin disaccharide deacetylase